MISAVAVVIVAAVIVGLVLLVRKAGKDDQRADAAEEALKDVQEANRPVSPSARERLRQRYKRD